MGKAEFSNTVKEWRGLICFTLEPFAKTAHREENKMEPSDKKPSKHKRLKECQRSQKGGSWEERMQRVWVGVWVEGAPAGRAAR